MENSNLTSFGADFMSAAQCPSSNSNGQHLPSLTAMPPLYYAQPELTFQYQANNICIPQHLPYVEPPGENMYIAQDLPYLGPPPLIEPSTANNRVDMTQGSSSVSVYMEPNNSCADLPPGYKFNPKDEELIMYYLMKKVSNQPLPSNYVIDVDVYKCTPWDLADKLMLSGDKKGYFFTPRDRRYLKGQRPNRRAEDGYWKATGADQKIKYNRRKPYYDNVYGDISCGDIIGTKRALVFYRGHASKGEKTQWIMHEYDLYKKVHQPNHEKGTAKDMKLDHCVLCSIYYKGKSLKGSSDHGKVNEPTGTTDFSHNNDNVQDFSTSIAYMQEVERLLDIRSSPPFGTIDSTVDFNHNDDNVQDSPTSFENMQEVEQHLDIRTSPEFGTTDGTVDFNHNDDNAQDSPAVIEYMQEVAQLLDIGSSLEFGTIDGGSESSGVSPINSANHIPNCNVDSFEEDLMKFVNGQ